jgi:LysM repeat protein
MKSSTCVFLFSLFLAGCSSHLAVMQQDKHDTSIALDEIRIELADLKHSLNNTQVELQILDEQVKSQDQVLQKGKTASGSSNTLSDTKIAALEKKLNLVEKQQEKIFSEMKQLTLHANQTSSSLSQYKSKINDLENSIHDQNQRIEEVVQLKSTLQSLTMAMKNPASTSGVYKVKPGDSLEKIAKSHQTSVDAIKKANNLTHNKILVGQELKIPSNE